MKSKTFYSRVSEKNNRLQTASKTDRSARRKELIDQFKTGWESAGLALQELRDDEHWKDTHTSWIEFCKDNFAISKTKLYEILKYTEVLGSLAKENQSKITSIDQGLALFKAPEKDRNTIIEKAENNGGLSADNLRFHGAKKVTKTNVTDKVTKVLNSGQSSSGYTESKPASESKIQKLRTVTFDRVGTIVPLDAIPYWERRMEVQKVLTQISKIRTDIKTARDGQDCLWVKHGQDAYEYLSRAYSYISDALPWAVCLQCQGSYSLQPDGCSACGNTGLISEYRFDHFLPKELREIRMKSNQSLAATHPESPLNTKPESANVC